MNPKRRMLPSLALLFCLACFYPHTASAASPDHWVGTWATAPMAESMQEARVAPDTTYREIVHVSIGGPAVRIILTNEFGLAPLTIGAANVALSAGGNEINTAASAPLTFNGRPFIVIPAGALVVSDPVNLKLPPTSNLAVSIFIPSQPIQQVSAHGYADQTNYTAPGNVVSAQSLNDPQKIYSWPFLKGVDVKAESKAAAIVAFGDSITDGAYSTRDANARWPDVLAARLQADKNTADFGVLNEGIGGNRVLHDSTGPSALARFDRDVLAQAGVKYLIILESINDIGHAQDLHHPYDAVTADDLIAGLSQLATRAHTHGIKVFGATLTPYVGAGYASPKGEAIRKAVNQWIRTTNQFDGIIDFDKVTRDPSNPEVFLPADDSGDQLHPNDTGYKAMGNSIDLKIFKDK